MEDEKLKIIKDTLESSVKEVKKLKKENDKLKEVKIPFTEATMTIEYTIDDSKKITLGASSKIINTIENTHQELYIKLLESLSGIISMTTGTKEE